MWLSVSHLFDHITKRLWWGRDPSIYCCDEKGDLVSEAFWEKQSGFCYMFIYVARLYWFYKFLIYSKCFRFFLLFLFIIIIIIIIIIISCEIFTSGFADGLLLKSEWQQVSQVTWTLLSILVDLSNDVVWNRLLISNSSSSLTKLLRTVPSATITIGITITFRFYSFLSSQARSKYTISFHFLWFLHCGPPRGWSILFGCFSFPFFFFFLFFLFSFC